MGRTHGNLPFGTRDGIGNRRTRKSSWGPAFNFDAAIQKATKVGVIQEGAILVFRAEFFNLFNHPQFATPTGSQLDFSNATVGQIASESVNTRLVPCAPK
jgi:hypothetical protein